MSVESGDMRRLAPTAQEDLRLRGVAALESGRVRTYGQAAEVFRVSERSVGTWWRPFRAAGRRCGNRAPDWASCSMPRRAGRHFRR
ncbi:hypothetical protein GCM10009753_72160 [Streptantibioticus ferralitis]